MLIEKTSKLDEMIEQNLAQYIEANSSSLPSDFKVKRELNIARHALEESLQVHTLATTVLRAAIASVAPSSINSNSLNASTPASNSNLLDAASLTRIITLANSLEERGHRLTQNCKTVANIAKTGAEIESLLASRLDAVQVYSIISQLPTILISIINSLLKSYFEERNYSIANGRTFTQEEVNAQVVPEIANLVANAFSEQIEHSVNVLTYNQHNRTFNQANSSMNSTNDTNRSGGVIESQVVAMLNTVPINPNVVEPNSQTAKMIRDIESA